MTNYTGTYVGVNATGKTISNVSIKHECGDKTNTTVLTAASLSPGQATSTQTLKSESGSGDDWTVSFELDGETKERDGKGCNMPNENGGCCVLVFYEDDFSVVTPDTSPCMHNHY
ncbi:hypothetical protein [Marimonas arenosa]|uniref:Uncharacterized protein n=1 Tax=Marimonas arenosa TaxID=1795305 RepID=A0AAE3WC65_9RHOB|nr:hypothetical protein [Marimonas arenosa]MDQ2090024.1 hypothetical protein [Marimonas arenosa]